MNHAESMIEKSVVRASADERDQRTFMLSFLLRGTRTAVLTRAGLMTAAIAVVDWRIEGNIPLGFLYLFPMLLVGSVLTRWQIAGAAAVCTLLTELSTVSTGSAGRNSARHSDLRRVFLHGPVRLRGRSQPPDGASSYDGDRARSAAREARPKSNSRCWWKAARRRCSRPIRKESCCWPTKRRTGFSSFRPARFRGARSTISAFAGQRAVAPIGSASTQ